MSLHIGTSGWAYPEWVPAFYPAGTRQREFLTFYASTLGACEINATHYRIHTAGVTGGWAAATPPAFRFAAKAHRALTHGRALPSPERPGGVLAGFLTSLTGLGDRLGVVLLQFPPTRERDDATLAGLLDCLPAGLPFALEFRHESWFVPEVEAAAADRGGTLCLSETLGAAVPRLPAGPVAYVRLRGDRYEPPAREAWRELLVREAAARPVYAFAKHKEAPAGDPFAGVGLAQWLVERTG